jgi:2-keto-4-pentenoate hydratase/2-oxohepta-3-ene-1,7-dioic acid hydratase in catechol pathway
MKLLRYGPMGQEIPCLLDEAGHIRDLSAHVDDFAGDTVSLETLDRLRALDIHQLPQLPHGARIGACLADVPNFICIGLNYAKHAAETGSTLPDEPLVFSKATSAITGPFDIIKIPPGSTHTDWEVELGVVIGKTCYSVSEDDALDYVAGYFTANDVSERTFQKHRSGQWIKGKSSPTFAPIGPYFVTADEIRDPQNLAVKTTVNGKVMQNSSTDDMIFSVKTIISKLSEYMELRVGDVIITGTPEGVGAGIKPKPQFLRAGDKIEIEVEGLGAQKMDVV